MAEGAYYIRIGLPPRVVSGDCLASSLYGLIDRYLHFLRAHVRCPMSGDLGVVLVRFTYLLLMRVGARFHGALYPMTGCVLYLDRLLCWWYSLDLLMLFRLLYDSITVSHCTGFVVFWLLVR